MSFKAKKITNDHTLSPFAEPFESDHEFEAIGDTDDVDPYQVGYLCGKRGKTGLKLTFVSGSRDGGGRGLNFSPPVEQSNAQPSGGYDCSNCAPNPDMGDGFGGTQDGNTTVQYGHPKEES